MNAAELIYQEAKDLPEALGAEVLDLIGYLKSRHPQSQETAINEENKLAELEVFFAPYHRDLNDFRFDRDEANER